MEKEPTFMQMMHTVTLIGLNTRNRDKVWKHGLIVLVNKNYLVLLLAKLFHYYTCCVLIEDQVLRRILISF